MARIAPGLHVVATPIGNLGDITLRALAALADADLIACEDTRVTRKLLDRYAIATPLTPYHDHNAAKRAHAVAPGSAEGAALALVSMPHPRCPTPIKLVAPPLKPGTRSRRCPAPRRWRAALAVAGLPTTSSSSLGSCRRRAARRARIAELAGIRLIGCSRAGHGLPRDRR